MKSRLQNFKEGMRDGLPICMGYFAVSFTFGMLALKSGLTLFQAVLTSASNLTSAGQFAALTLISSGGSYYEMALTQLVINIRYLLMSCTLSQKIEPDMGLFHRCATAFGVTDEIFGIECAKTEKVSPYYSYGAMSVAIPGWVGGTFFGALSGSVMPPSLKSALGVAIYGMFLAIIVPPAKQNKAIFYTIAAAMALSTLFKLLEGVIAVSPGFQIIIVTVLISALAAWLFPLRAKTATEA